MMKLAYYSPVLIVFNNYAKAWDPASTRGKMSRTQVYHFVSSLLCSDTYLVMFLGIIDVLFNVSRGENLWV